MTIALKSPVAVVGAKHFSRFASAFPCYLFMISAHRSILQVLAKISCPECCGIDDRRKFLLPVVSSVVHAVISRALKAELPRYVASHGWAWIPRHSKLHPSHPIPCTFTLPRATFGSTSDPVSSTTSSGTWAPSPPINVPGPHA
jgi:hypothetical protein